MSPGVLVQRVAPLLVSSAVLVWLVARVDGPALVSALTPRVAAILLPALLVYGAVALLFEAVSIVMLVDDRPKEFGLFTVARIKCASYLLGIVNYALGAGALVVLLRRRSHLALAGAASLVLLIALVDFALVFALVSVGAIFIETLPAELQVLLLAGDAGILAGLALLRARFSLGPLEVVRGLEIFRALREVTWSRLLRLVAVRAVFVSSFVAICASTFAAFEVAAPAAVIVVGMLVVGFVAGLPIAVAGLGTSQAAFLLIFSPYASEETLLTQSLVLSAGMLLMRALMGVVFAREFTREAWRESQGPEA